MEFLYGDLTSDIINAAYTVSRALRLRRGYNEANFAQALGEEVRRRKHRVRAGVELPRRYGYTYIGKGIADLVVDYRVVVEVKKKSRIRDEDRHQLLAYLLDSGLEVGLLINFSPTGPQVQRLEHTRIRHVEE